MEIAFLYLILDTAEAKKSTQETLKEILDRVSDIHSKIKPFLHRSQSSESYSTYINFVLI